MYISKFRVALVVVILSAIIFISSIVALLNEYYIIPSSGSIGPPVARLSGDHSSEIRAIFIHSISSINPDWDLIMQTAKDYGIDIMVLETTFTMYAHYPSDYVPYGEVTLPDAIIAAHARGMQFHISMNVLLGALSSEYQVVAADGSSRYWTCPTKEISRTLLKNLVEEVATNYDIDGLMFDYARYDLADECYCSECKAKFEQYLGETIPDSNWPPNIEGGGDFGPGGSRYHEFMEWRTHPINDLIRDMRAWLLAIKPNLEISAAVWAIYNLANPTERRFYLGQDFTYWIKEGYLDWVAAMMYTTDLDMLTTCVQASAQYATGGPQGKIPSVAFLANCYPGPIDPVNFKAQIDTIRAAGAEGWAIWRYGGPGDGQGSGAPDIRDYLNLIDLYPRFSIKNINASTTEDTCTITWTTDLPATSKVEFSTSPLFNASFKYLQMSDFHYWDVDHVPGTVVEDTTPVTDHSITLTGLSPETKYYFRVRSQDANGIATSKVFTFEL